MSNGLTDELRARAREFAEERAWELGGGRAFQWGYYSTGAAARNEIEIGRAHV